MGVGEHMFHAIQPLLFTLCDFSLYGIGDPRGQVNPGSTEGQCCVGSGVICINTKLSKMQIFVKATIQ